MNHPYEEMLGQIRAPARLEQQVMRTAAAGRVSCPRRKPGQQIAICVACLLLVLLGGISCFRGIPADKGPADEAPAEENMQITGKSEESPCVISLAACTPAANSGFAFVESTYTMNFLTKKEDAWVGGELTDYHFQISGEGFQKLRLTVDKGGLYRCEQGVYQLKGQTVAEDYAPEASYGFWIPQTAVDDGTGLSIYDAAHLVVSGETADGTVSTAEYNLSVGGMKEFTNEDGTAVLVPILKGDQETYWGLYAVPVDSPYFRWPVADCKTVSLSYPFGEREESAAAAEKAELKPLFHVGIDIPAPEGSTITAAMGGTVIEAGFTADQGNFLTLDHGNGLTTTYAHCRAVTVQTGAAVLAGQEIASVGSTGVSTGAHLCFQVRQDGVAVNPVAYFDPVLRSQLRGE